jgi:prepilin-type processing-associated H-X9-DG protein
MHEPPARPYKASASKKLFFHWHFARGRTDVPFGDLKNDDQKFISPVLFVDGHAAKHDFTTALRSDLTNHFEPTKDWVWYKPAAVSRQR